MRTVNSYIAEDRLMPKASIVIVTRNRKERAKLAVESALSQQGDNEVLAMDDGSTDGTSEYLSGIFPAARVVKFDQQAGYIVRRTQGGKLATGDVLFSIDDDAVFADALVVTDTLKMFNDPRIAVAMIPHTNCTADDLPLWSAPLPPNDGQTYVCGTFIGTAYAVRRDVFNALGGYQDCLFHWGEEAEFSQRLTNAGYLIAAGTRHRVRHYPQFGGKYDRRNLIHIYRNRILTVWFNAPLLLLPALLPLQIAHACKMAMVKWRERLVALEGTWVGLREMFRYRHLRHPLPLRAYLFWLKLHKQKLMNLTEASTHLPRPVKH